MKAKRITKKEIQAVLRSLDATAIYRLYHKLYGTVSKSGVYDFIKQNAPSKRVIKFAIAALGAASHNVKRRVIDSEVIRPMMGRTYLYFCSPIYGHDDYNKVREIPIAGNERFCELLIKYADKYFAPIYGK